MEFSKSFIKKLERIYTNLNNHYYELKKGGLVFRAYSSDKRIMITGAQIKGIEALVQKNHCERKTITIELRNPTTVIQLDYNLKETIFNINIEEEGKEDRTYNNIRIDEIKEKILSG